LNIIDSLKYFRIARERDTSFKTKVLLKVHGKKRFYWSI